MNRKGIPVARRTVAQIMRELGIEGAVRGRRFKTTTVAEETAERPLDLVARDFRATRPNELWVSDLTYVATWRGFAYVAFVIDVFSRRIVGWRVSSSLLTDLALEAPEQAICERDDDRAVQDGADPEGFVGSLDDVELSTLKQVYLVQLSPPAGADRICSTGRVTNGRITVAGMISPTRLHSILELSDTPRGVQLAWIMASLMARSILSMNFSLRLAIASCSPDDVPSLRAYRR